MLAKLLKAGLLSSLLLLFIWAIPISVSADSTWTANTPAGIQSNIIDSAGATDKGLVAITGNGKMYYIWYGQMRNSNPHWQAANIDSDGENFVGVTYGMNDSFWAVTKEGTLFTSTSGDDWTSTSLTSAGSQIDLTDAAHITSDSSSLTIYLSNNNCIVAGTDRTAQNTYTLSGLTVNGITNIPGGNIVYYGTNSTNISDNIVSYSGSMGMSSTIAALTTVNDMLYNSADAFFAVGTDAAQGAITTSVDGSAATILDANGNVKTSIPPINAIDYNFSEGIGFAVGNEGTIYQITGTSNPVIRQIGAGVTSEDLNAVYYDETNSKVFIEGANGASIFYSIAEPEWEKTETPKSGNSAFGTQAHAFSSGYTIIGSGDNNIYSSSDGINWTQTTATGHLSSLSAGHNPKFDSSDSDNYLFFRTGNTPIQVYLTRLSDGATNRIEWNSISFSNYIIKNNSVYLFSESGIAIIPLADLEGASDPYIIPSSDINTDIAFYSVGDCSHSSKYVYVIDNNSFTGVSDLKISSTVSNTSTYPYSGSDPDSTTFTTVTLSGVTLHRNSLSLYAATDGKLVVVDSYIPKIYIVDDPAEDQDLNVSNVLTVSSTLNLPTLDTYSAHISGPSDHLVMYDDNNIYQYTGSEWKAISRSDLTADTGFSSMRDVLSNGADSLIAYDALDIAYYNTSPTGTVSTGDALTTGVSGISIDQNHNVYMGGSGNILHGVLSNEGNITWDETPIYLDGMTQGKNVWVRGQGNFTMGRNFNSDGTLFVLSTKRGSDPWEIGTFDPEPNGGSSISGAVAIGEDLYVCGSRLTNSGASIVRAKLDGAGYTYTEQTASGSSQDEMPSRLTNPVVTSDGSAIYAFSNNSLYKLSNNSGDSWDVEIILTSSSTLNNIYIDNENSLYICGTSGYLAIVKDDSVTEIDPESRSSENFISVTASGNFVYLSENDGTVWQYNIEAETWGSQTVAQDMTNTVLGVSDEDNVLVAAGNIQGKTAVYTTPISEWGQQSSTDVAPGQGESTSLVSESTSSNATAGELDQNYDVKEPTVVGSVKRFTTGTITSGSIHNFQYNVTPSEDVSVNKLRLQKLLPATSTHISYNRLNSTPSSLEDGTYWVSDSTGSVLSAGDSLTAGSVYTIHFVIKDGGRFDADGIENGVIVDPTVLTARGGGSSSGCVFNPDQGFGLEWLMLLLFPILAAIRAKIIRK